MQANDFMFSNTLIIEKFWTSKSTGNIICLYSTIFLQSGTHAEQVYNIN